MSNYWANVFDGLLYSTFLILLLLTEHFDSASTSDGQLASAVVW